MRPRVAATETRSETPASLVSAAAVAQRVRQLAREADRRFQGTRPLLIGVLTGAYVFLADLSREMRVAHDVAFVRAGSYGDAATPAADVTLDGVGTAGAAGRDLLVIEDVLDTGHTLAALLSALRRTGARSLATCVLVVKVRPPQYPIVPDMVGFVVPPVFVVGYGIDYRGAWRHLPYLGAIDPGDRGEPDATRETREENARKERSAAGGAAPTLGRGRARSPAGRSRASARSGGQRLHREGGAGRCRGGRRVDCRRRLLRGSGPT